MMFRKAGGLVANLDAPFMRGFIAHERDSYQGSQGRPSPTL